MGRLVSEISTARTVEKALYARRLLLSGRQVPEVYATEVAREHADNSIAELDKEIENLLFETRVTQGSGLRHRCHITGSERLPNGRVHLPCQKCKTLDPKSVARWACSITSDQGEKAFCYSPPWPCC